MNITRISIQRPVTTSMFFLAVFLLGFLALREQSVDLLPSMKCHRLLVMTRYPGVSPEEMEVLVTVPLEARLSEIPGIQRLESVSREGLSRQILEFSWGTDMDFALLRTREKLDRTDLPRGVEEPVIKSLDPGLRPIMIFALSGGRELEELKEISEDLIKPRLEQVEGIASVEIIGGAEREIQVLADPRLLSLFGLTVKDISQRLDELSCDIPGGTIRKGRFQFALRVERQIQSIRKIEDVSLKGTKGGAVKLRDVARVIDSVMKQSGVTKFNGMECIGVLVRKDLGANTVRTTRLAKRILEDIKRNSPGVDIHIVHEQGEYIEKSISSVLEALLYGGILAFVVLVLFLRDLVAPFIIAVVVPISVSATFSLLYFQGITLNVMSLGGLALGVGMLVDNSIVVSESIVRQRALKDTISDAVLTGTDEVKSAITASTLTTISVFLPVLYIRGIEGYLFKDQAISVALSLLSSLLVSLTLLPMLCSLFSGSRSRKKRPIIWCMPGEKVSCGKNMILKSATAPLRGFARLATILVRRMGSLFIRIFSCHHHLLLWSLNNKGRIIAGGVVFLLLTFAVVLKIPRELLPKPEDVSFKVELQAPAEFSLEQTKRSVGIIEKWLKKEGVARTFFSEIGIVRGMEISHAEISTSSARIHVVMQNSTQMKRTMKRLRERLERIQDFSFSINLQGSSLAPFLDMAGSEIMFRIKGNDLRNLGEIAHQLAEKITTVDGIVDVRRNTGEGKRCFLISARRDVLDRHGIQPEALYSFITDAVRGRREAQFEEWDRRFEIFVRYEEKTEKDIGALLDSGFLHRGNLIPLRGLLDCRIVRGPNEIRRENQQREALVLAHLQGRKLSQVIPDLREKIRELAIPPGFRIDLDGEQEEMKKSFRSLFLACGLAAVLVYMIMGAQFESLLHPFLIMFTLPVGWAGAAWGLWLTGETMNVISIIGIIVLTGIVVNDAIVKIDYTNQLRRKGWELRDAILEASRIRLKPILMTTVTTVFGLLPLSLRQGSGSELQRPLAISVIGGLIIATFLTLILIPIAYELLEKRKR